MDISLWEGQLLFGKVGGRRGAGYFRVVWVDVIAGVAFIRQVFPSVPETARLPQKFLISAIVSRIKKGTLEDRVECIRPRGMSERRESDEAEFQAVEIQRYRRALLGKLIEPEGRRQFYAGPHERSKLLSQQVRRSGVSRQRLLWLLTYYENFGCDLIALRPFPSSPERARGAVHAKRGAKNQYEKENHASSLKGYPVTRWALRHIQWAVWHLVIVLGFTYEDARVMMHRLFWHQDNGSAPLGTRVRYPVKESRMVTKSEFSYYARRYKKYPERLRRLVGQHAWRDDFRAGYGRASDIALGPGDILVIDATLAKFEIVSSRTGRPIGRPTMYIVADAYLTTILAIHITLRSERVDGYRHVLFRACTSNSHLMRFLGLPEKFFDFEVRPNELFVDRLPGKSRQAREYFVGPDSLAISMMIAPTACGRAKGVVEGLMNVLIRRLRNIRGAFTRERTERAEEQRRQSKLVANVTAKELLRHAYEAAKEYNSVLVTEKCTIDDRRLGFKDFPTREFLFKLAMEKLHQRSPRRLTDLDVYSCFLNPLPHRQMQKEGIRRRGAIFTNSTYRMIYEKEIARCLGVQKKMPMIEIFEDPDDPNILFWRRSDGVMDVLKCSPTDADRWRDLIMEDIESDLTPADNKVAIRYQKVNTFHKVLPSCLTQALINGRRHDQRKSIESGAQDREDEQDLELRKAAAMSRTYSEQFSAASSIADGTPSATEAERPSSELDEAEEVERERARRRQELDQHLSDFLKPKER
jgi:hypothetical protein